MRQLSRLQNQASRDFAPEMRPWACGRGPSSAPGACPPRIQCSYSDLTHLGWLLAVGDSKTTRATSKQYRKMDPPSLPPRSCNCSCPPGTGHGPRYPFETPSCTSPHTRAAPQSEVQASGRKNVENVRIFAGNAIAERSFIRISPDFAQPRGCTRACLPHTLSSSSCPEGLQEAKMCNVHFAISCAVSFPRLGRGNGNPTATGSPPKQLRSERSN